ncbi:MAG: histidine phosphatase family protein [Clostridiales bacterium]|nr:histidine phosphatase family protein [Clostridiales bacterium]
MRLIFIRHAEPDYSIDSLTTKGHHEAALLAERIQHWKVTDFFCSPLGRAKDTAKPSLDKLQRTAKELPWLEEFKVPISRADHPARKTIPWDLTPDYLNQHPELFDGNEWTKSPLMQIGNVEKRYQEVITEFDKLLSSYGYHRHGLIYSGPNDGPATNHFMQYDDRSTEHLKENRADDTTLVFFCHLGVMMAILSHLINASPCVPWQGFFVAPSSVTVLASEERTPGEAYFRCQMLGDTSHLRIAGEPVSYYGYFTAPFQG